MTGELTWYDVLAEEKQQPYLLDTLQTVISEWQSGVTIYPPQKDVSNVFRFTELGDIKVVILGQDSYHESGQAHGLVFPARLGTIIPSSLLNMYEEPENTIPGFTRPDHGYLESWARQDVLPFNTVLAVRTGRAYSHTSLGRGTFTDRVISLINQHREGVMLLLWGSHAQKKGATIDKQRYHILRVSHPSPFSVHRGLSGCSHFVLASRWLE